jgi:hypothetical protein
MAMMPKTTRRILAVLAVLSVLAGAFILRGRKGMVDFQVNYQAAQRLRAGETLYRQEDGHYQFKYPPFSALLYVPVSFLPADPAKAVWFILVLSCSILVFYLSLVLVRPTGRSVWVLSLFTSLMLAKFFLREIQLGQINALITSLLLVMLALLAKNEESPASAARDGLAGAVWGISWALKPYTAIFLPYWILKGKWKTLLAGVIAGALAFMGPALYYGLEGNLVVHREWIHSLSRSTPLLLTTQDNISLIALFMKWTGRPAVSRVLYLSSIALLALLAAYLIARGRKKSRAMVLEAALLLVYIPLVSPLGWDYTLLSSALAVMVILSQFANFPPSARVLFVFNAIIMGLSLYDLMGRSLYAKFMAMSIPTLNALVLVGYLAWLRMEGRA